MKRLLFSLFALGCISGLTTAQTILFEDNFDSGAMSDQWTTIDADGDGNNWEFVDLSTASESPYMAVTSYSWSPTTSTALTPDNYLVTPSLAIPTGEETTLYYEVIARDASWDLEKYSVYVATEATEEAFLATTPVLTEESLDNVNTLSPREIDLTPYAGQTVYVAFRHYDVTDQFSMAIDNVAAFYGGDIGDGCALPIRVSAGTHTVEEIDGNAPDNICSGAGTAAQGKWYKLDISTPSYVTVSTDLAANTGGDTRFHVYSGTCDALNCIGSSDDLSDTNALSYLGFMADTGSYLIAFDSFASTDGFDFEITLTEPVCNTEFPIEENFDSNANFYGCYAMEGDGWTRMSMDINGDGTEENFALNSATGEAEDAYFIGPGLAISANATYTLEAHYAGWDYEGSTANDALEILVLDAPDSSANVVATLFTQTGITQTGSLDDLVNSPQTATGSFTASEAGTLYFAFRANSAGANGGIVLFDYNITRAFGEGDSCAQATAITPGTYTVDAVNGEAPTEICGETTVATSGEWYTYTPTSDIYVTVNTSLSSNSDGDTRLFVYQGTCDNLVCVGVSDDNSSSDYYSTLSFNAEANTTYYIAFDNRWNSGGFDFELSTQVVDCSTSIPFTEDFVDDSTFGNCYTVVDNDGNEIAWIRQSLDLDSDGTMETFATNGADDGPSDDYLFTMGFDLTGGQEYTFTTHYNGADNGTTAAAENLVISLVDAPSVSANTIEELVNHQGVTQNGEFATLESSAYMAQALFTPDADGTYYVSFHVSSSDANAFLLVFDYSIQEGNMAVDNLATLNDDFKVYPNPASHIVNIETANDFDTNNAKINIYSANGKKAASTKFTEQIDVSSLPIGVYIIEMSDGKQVIRRKLIKK